MEGGGLEAGSFWEETLLAVDAAKVHGVSGGRNKSAEPGLKLSKWPFATASRSQNR